jgi:hypothetical protein
MLCLFVVSICCVYLLCLFVVSICCVDLLCRFVVSICCVDLLCRFVVSICCVNLEQPRRKINVLIFTIMSLRKFVLRRYINVKTRTSILRLGCSTSYNLILTCLFLVYVCWVCLLCLFVVSICCV